MRQFIITSFISASMLLNVGCTSLVSRGIIADMGKQSQYYPGLALTKNEVIPDVFGKEHQPLGVIIGIPFLVIDTPLSLVVDTLLLPKDIYDDISKRN